MMSLQGKLSIERMCQLAQVSRAGFYRSRVPRQASPVEMEIRDELQRIAVESPASAIEELPLNCRNGVLRLTTNGCCG